MDSIYTSAYNGDFDKVKEKLEQNPNDIHNCDSNGRLLMHWAAMSGNLKLVTMLIELGSQVEARDETDVTPFILAASAGKADVCRILMNHGADVNSKSNQGHSALQYACSKGWLEIAEMIVNKKGDINIRDIRGATPLHRAASKGNTSVVKFLCEQPEIDVNAKDSYGNTPLHLACEEDRVEEAKMLVKQGARTDTRNKDRLTPLELCSVTLARIITNLNAPQQ